MSKVFTFKLDPHTRERLESLASNRKCLKSAVIHSPIDEAAKQFRKEQLKDKLINEQLQAS